ncbi:MAG: intradiol ring-cleavage dioxygenase, partial [Acidimicrobiia bacterium]|nr:intradiol ring-cleavage dioxygenase [Acidimicrobiia bacterium]
SIATDLLSRLAPPLDPTPAQAEGPYYPPIKPTDTDNDLYELTGASGAPAGTELTIEGLLVDTAAIPIAGAIIELWQTDAEGLYLHPDFDGEPLDQNFQYFGTSVTDEDGLWRFRTVEPLNYENRPKHLHIKVLDGEIALLTTQIYFSGDPLLDSDRVIGDVDLELLTATTEPRGSGLYATHVLVIDG